MHLLGEHGDEQMDVEEKLKQKKETRQWIELMDEGQKKEKIQVCG